MLIQPYSFSYAFLQHKHHCFPYTIFNFHFFLHLRRFNIVSPFIPSNGLPSLSLTSLLHFFTAGTCKHPLHHNTPLLFAFYSASIFFSHLFSRLRLKIWTSHISKLGSPCSISLSLYSRYLLLPRPFTVVALTHWAILRSSSVITQCLVLFVYVTAHVKSCLRHSLKLCIVCTSSILCVFHTPILFSCNTIQYCVFCLCIKALRFPCVPKLKTFNYLFPSLSNLLCCMVCQSNVLFLYLTV